MNTQNPEPSIFAEDGSIEVHSAFLTIQGEGPFAGARAVFIRLAGCNIQCPGCDTEYTSNREKLKPEEIVQLCQKLGMPWPAKAMPLVVITGGEPLRQRIGPTCAELIRCGFRVQIETNGTLWTPIPDEVTIICSPKTGRINPTLADRVDAFKYVVEAGKIDPADGLPTSTLNQEFQRHVARPPEYSRAAIFVQPFDAKDGQINAVNTQAAVDTCLRFGYRLCLQMHKFANLP